MLGEARKPNCLISFLMRLRLREILMPLLTFIKNGRPRLDARLVKIDQREALLQAQYTKQFSEMEKVVNDVDFVSRLCHPTGRRLE